MDKITTTNTSDSTSINIYSLLTEERQHNDKYTSFQNSKDLTEYITNETEGNSSINISKKLSYFKIPIKLKKKPKNHKICLTDRTYNYEKKEKIKEFKNEEKDVKNLTLWEHENISYKEDNYNMLFSALKNLYSKENSLSKLKDLETISSIMKLTKSTNSYLSNTPVITNATLAKFYLKNKQDEGTILMNSLAKSKSVFNKSLFEEKNKKDLTSFNLDIETLESMKEENLEKTKDLQRDTQNRYYRKLINDKAREESRMRDDLIKIANKISAKKEEKEKIKIELELLYQKKNKTEEKYIEDRNNLKNQLIQIEELYNSSRKIFNKKTKDYAFKNMSLKASNYNNIVYQIEELGKEHTKKMETFERIKDKYYMKLNLINEEQGYLKFVYFSMIREQRTYYLRILSNGYDVRYEGLVWCIKHLLEMGTNLEYYHFPKFLDHEQIDYLISQAKSYLLESLLSLTLHILKKKQKERREEEKQKEYNKLKDYAKERYNMKKTEKLKVKKKEDIVIKKDKNNIKQRVLKSYNELFNKYKEAFKFSETTTLNDEEQAKKIFIEIRDSIISKGNYVNNDKQNLILKFLEENPKNKIQLKAIFDLRDKIKQVQNERNEEKRKMIEKMKEKEQSYDRYANTKLSVEFDLVFSALFGSNIS